MNAEPLPLTALLRPEWSALGPRLRQAIALWYAVLDPDTEDLLALVVPRLLRHLRHRGERQLEEADGRIRGHIHWPSTVRAQAARGPGTFTVRTTRRVYDLPENQLLRWQLHAVGHALDHLPAPLREGYCAGESAEPVGTRTRHLGVALARIGRDQRLANVSLPARPDPAMLQRAMDTGIPEYQALARHAAGHLALAERCELAALYSVGERLVLLPGEASAAALPWSRVAALITARNR